MSLVCESVKNSNDATPSLSHQNELTKNSLDEEELDYEEEVDEGRLDDKLNQDVEEGQISDGESEIKIKESVALNKNNDKDEGEIDSDDDLEEGEVKEDSENEEKSEEKPETNLKPNVNQRFDNRSIQSRLDLSRQSNTFNNNNSNWNSNPSNSRYTLQPIRRPNEDRYGRSRPALLPPPVLQPAPTESAWERGLKQARELISKASKRKEEETEYEGSSKRYTLSVRGGGEPVRERSPYGEKRRRYSSQQSSSEDETERRHRLAYDAAPWNNPHAGRSRSTLHSSSNRSAETYRDPWRRSKSPIRLAEPATRSRKPDSRYGETYKRERTRSDANRSDSLSSLSSLHSDSSDISSGRKLPYTRPAAYESRDKFAKEDVTNNNERDYSKTRMDRIPKKPNVSQSQSGERVSEAKSFDSWSDSLSESDSSSVSFSNSDSESNDSGDDEKVERKPHKTTCKYSRERNPSSSTVNSSAQHKSKVPVDAKLPKSAPETQRKAPIKMTFMKKTTSIQKDRLFEDDPMNGETSDIGEVEKELFAQNKETTPVDNKSDEDSEDINLSPTADSQEDPSKLHRREELLLKLKAVEEAIERKLNSKKD